MAKMIPLDVVYEYENEKEEMNAQIIPFANLTFIKTQLSFERRRRSNLVPDPNNYPEFIQQHAAISGTISAYEFLINSHEDVVRRLAVE